MEEEKYFDNLTNRSIVTKYELDIKFPSLHKFYTECDIIDYKYQDGAYTHHELDYDVDEDWVGLSRSEILKSKYTYKTGLDLLEKIEKDIFLGGTKRLYKWDEFDGDDMNYDRLLEGLPSMRKRYRTNGTNSGRFVTIHVSIGENCNVTYEEMLNRAYTVMQLIDYLESNNYRIAVTVFFEVANACYYKENEVRKLRVEVPIKLENEPLIKGQILTCISPWMLRYHVFKLLGAKFRTRYGLGQAINLNHQSTLSNIYFNTEECLDVQSANKKLKEIIKLYEKA